MRRWQRFGPLLTVVVIMIIVVAVIGIPRWLAAHQFTLRMRPAPALTMAACIAQANLYGWPVLPHRPSICSEGQGRPWYHAVLINHGSGAYPLCHATGFDSYGRTAFSGTLFFNFGNYPAGLYAKGHRSIAFSWYIPSHVLRPITRYVATCTVNESPPI